MSVKQIGGIVAVGAAGILASPVLLRQCDEIASVRPHKIIDLPNGIAPPTRPPLPSHRRVIESLADFPSTVLEGEPLPRINWNSLELLTSKNKYSAKIAWLALAGYNQEQVDSLIDAGLMPRIQAVFSNSRMVWQEVGGPGRDGQITLSQLEFAQRLASDNPRVSPRELLEALDIAPSPEVDLQAVAKELREGFPEDLVKAHSFDWLIDARSIHRLYRAKYQKVHVIGVIPQNATEYLQVFGHEASVNDLDYLARATTILRDSVDRLTLIPDLSKYGDYKEINDALDQASRDNAMVIMLGHSVSHNETSRSLVFPSSGRSGAYRIPEDQLIFNGLKHRVPTQVLTCFGEDIGLGIELRYDDMARMIERVAQYAKTTSVTPSQARQIMREAHRDNSFRRIRNTSIVIGGTTGAIIYVSIDTENQ